MATELYLTSDWLILNMNHLPEVSTANQKLVSFMCGLGLVGGPEAGLSGLAGLSAEGGTSAGDAATLR